MSESSCCSPACKKAFAAVVGVAGTLAVLGLLTVYLVRANRPTPVGTARGDERKKIWTELQNANAETLNNYGIVRADNGTYRLPVAKAMEVLVAEWKDGNAAGRTKMLQRLEASQKAVSYE